MSWRRRQTYVVSLNTRAFPELAPTAVATDAFYRAALDALRQDATRIVADLFGRTGPLPPTARQAASTLHRLNQPDLLGTTDRNPFQGVVVNDGNPGVAAALAAVAAPPLRPHRR